MFESSLSASRSRSVNGGNGAGVISLISAFPVASDRGGGPRLLHILGSKLSDKAIESGSAKALTKILTEAVQEGVADRFKEVSAKKKYKSDDVETGRQYIKAYVEFVHYIERIHEAAKNDSEGHYPEPQGTALKQTIQ